MPLSLPASRRLVKWGTLGDVFSLSLTFYAVVPYFAPAMHNDYRLTVAQTGWIIAALPIGLLMASFLTAPLRLHRYSIQQLRLMMVATSVVSSLGMCGIGLTPPLLAASDGGRREPALGPAALTLLMATYRFVDGVVLGIGDTIGLVMLTRVFPGEASDIVALTETCAGLGALAGPVLGGGLYDLGGFAVPPVVLAVVNTVFVVACTAVPLHPETEADPLPAATAAPPVDSSGTAESATRVNASAAGGVADSEPRADNERAPLTDAGQRHGHGPEPRFSPAQVGRVMAMPFPLVAGPLLVTIVCMGAFAFFEGIGPLYMRNHLDYSATATGGLFAGAAMIYATSAIVSGHLLSRQHTSRRAVALPLGALLMGAGAFLSGPAYHAAGLSAEPVDKALTLAAMRGIAGVGFIFLAVGLAIVVVAGQAAVVDAAMSLDPKMANAGGGLASACLSSASFLGMVGGSHLMATMDFPQVEAVFAAAIIAACFIYVVGVAVTAACVSSPRTIAAPMSLD